MKSSNPTAAQLIRAELKANFPGFKFSVTSDYNSIRIRWTDGPAPKKIQEITSKYKAGHFNGMEDIYEYDRSNPDLPKAKYIFDEREVSEALKMQAAADLHIPAEEVNTYTGERRIYNELQERSYDANGKQIVAVVEEVAPEPVEETVTETKKTVGELDRNDMFKIGNEVFRFYANGYGNNRSAAFYANPESPNFMVLEYFYDVLPDDVIESGELED